MELMWRVARRWERINWYNVAGWVLIGVAWLMAWFTIGVIAFGWWKGYL